MYYMYTHIYFTFLNVKQIVFTEGTASNFPFLNVSLPWHAETSQFLFIQGHYGPH